MERRKVTEKVIYIFIIAIIFLALGFNRTCAQTIYTQDVVPVEYREEYKKWLELSDEEKSKYLVPEKYNFSKQQDNINYINGFNNILKAANFLKSSFETKYSLKDFIYNNVQIRNQEKTDTCWDFASIASLESNLAFQDYKNGKTETIYDFSERHMDYATAYAAFLDNKTNTYGFNRNISAGGNFYYAASYLTDGMGAINENELPFENNQNNIDISNIQNKTISATVLDTKVFAIPTTDAERISSIEEIKQFISNYGGVYSPIYADPNFLTSDYYNNETGAMYSSGKKANHAVCIIGWDDNYDKTNFNAKNQPTSNGAWIIKNSWGSSETLNMSDIKNEYYTANTVECNNYGWTSATQIPDDTIMTMLRILCGSTKVTLNNGVVNIVMGNDGYMYVSYEDMSVYSEVRGIKKSEVGKSYYKLYENDIYGCTGAFKTHTTKQLYLANVFNRENISNEKLYRISIYAPETYTCQFYVNPNDSNKALTSMQQVSTKLGDTITIEPGFHTFELVTPLKLTGSSFVVATKILAADQVNGSEIDIGVECPDTTTASNAVVNEGESFFTIEALPINETDWIDSKTAILGESAMNSNMLLKAYTTNIEDSGTTGNTSSNITNNIDNSNTSTNTTNNIDNSNISTNTTNNIDNSNTSTNTTNNIDNSNTSTNTTNSINNSNTTNIIANNTISNNNNTTAENTNTVNNNTNLESESDNDLKNSTATIENSETYYDTTDESGNYSVLTIKIDKINKINATGTYKYYYYISQTQGDKNIDPTYWTEINKSNIVQENDGTYTISLKIKSTDLKNYKSLVDADNLFMYIKETITQYPKTSTIIATMQIKNVSKTVYYVNGIKAGSAAEVTNNTDITTATKDIPQTGSMPTIIIAILGILFVGLSTYAIYEKNNNMLRGK